MMKIIAAIVAVCHLLLTCYEINSMLQCYYAACNHLQRQRLLRLVHLTVIRQKKLRKRKERQFWVAPGRTSAWWSKFLLGEVMEAGWKNNLG